MVEKLLVARIAGALVLVCGIIFQPGAGAAAEPVQSAYDPPVGSRWSIVSEGREEKFQDGKSVETTTSTRKEELTIVEKTATGYRISSVIRSFDFHGGRAEAGANALVGAVRDVVVRGVVDEAGRPVLIENLEEVEKAHRQGFDRMLETFRDNPAAVAKIRALLEPLLAQIAQDPKEAAQWYLDTLRQLSVAQNSGLRTGEERRTSDTTSSPLGGGAIKTNVTLRLVEADPATGKAKLLRTQAYDPEALKALVAELAKRVVSGSSLDELQKVMKEMSLAMDDRTEFILEHGMTTSVSENSSLEAKAMGHVVSKREQSEISVTAMP